MDRMKRQVEYNRRWREKHREKYNKQQREYKQRRMWDEVKRTIKGNGSSSRSDNN